MSDEVIELILRTRVEGAEETESAAKATRSFSRAETRAIEVVGRAAEAQERLNAARQAASRITPGAAASSAAAGPGVSGNNYAVAQKVAGRTREGSESVRAASGRRRNGSGATASDNGTESVSPEQQAPPRKAAPQGVSSGPFSRLADLSKRLETAKAGNVPEDALKDLKYRHSLAQKHVDKISAPPPSTASKVAKAVLSSRFGLGGAGGGGAQMMPLVGQTLGAAGISGGAATALMMNPYVRAGIAVLKFATSAVDAANAAGEAGTRFSALRFESGGTSAESARLYVMGQATGVNTAALSQRINERITSDSYAMATAAQMGAYNLKGPFGNQDHAANTLKIIDGLRRIQDPQQRLRAARALGAEDALPMTLINDKMYKRMGEDARVMGLIMDPEFEKRAAEFNAAKKRAEGANEAVKVAFGKKFMPVITGILNGYADVAYSVASFIDGNGFSTLGNGDGTYGQSGSRVGGRKPGSPAQSNNEAAQGVASSSASSGTNATPQGASSPAGGGSSSGFGANTAAISAHSLNLSKNTEAINRLASQLASQGEGRTAYGDKDGKAEKALPASLMGINLMRAANLNALNLSAV